MFIVGSEMDWEESAMASRFTFTNPNETARCGCGESYRRRGHRRIGAPTFPMFDIAVLAPVPCFSAGAVKGVIGLGLPTVSLALLTLALDLPTAMALLLVPSLSPIYGRAWSVAI